MGVKKIWKNEKKGIVFGYLFIAEIIYVQIQWIQFFYCWYFEFVFASNSHIWIILFIYRLFVCIYVVEKKELKPLFSSKAIVLAERKKVCCFTARKKSGKS